MSVYAEVVFALPMDRSYTYRVPHELAAKVDRGMRILAPLGSQDLTGFVVGIRRRRPSGDFEIKTLIELLDDEPVFSHELLKFTRRLARWYYASWGEVLQAALPPALIVRSRTRFEVKRELELAHLHKRLSMDEMRLVEFLARKPYTERYLRRRFPRLDVGARLSGLERKGVVVRVRELQRPASPPARSVTTAAAQLELDFSLDRESREAALRLGRDLAGPAHRAVLLNGPAEKRHAIYFALLKQCISQNRRALVLMPEIAQTQGLRRELEKKIGERVALLHSRLSPAQRTAQWERIRKGEAEVVIGPRSALFAPLMPLGLIIVDEEHDTSYQQREGPAYDARRGALLRARQTGSLLLYGSDWPSVELYHRARREGAVLTLSKSLQPGFVEIIDDAHTSSIISARIITRIRRRLDSQHGPVLIFCSRRGYASFLSCSKCGAVPRCQRCDVAMSFHKKDARLLCHYCGGIQAFPQACQDCGCRVVTSRGPGIEVIAEEIKRAFPQRTIRSFDPDEAARRPVQERILADFSLGRIDILLGTPLLAHRFHLPPVSLVAVFHPEATLSAADIQSGPRTAHHIRMMARFLDAAKDTEFLVQTAFPRHHGIRAAALGRYGDYFEKEIHYRRSLHLPPFTYLAEIIVQGRDLRSLARKTRDFVRRIQATESAVDVLGPSLAPVSRVRGRNRVQMLVKASRKAHLDRALREPLARVGAGSSVLIYS
jgi:primosomal protein N' (replication factor Y)